MGTAAEEISLSASDVYGSETEKRGSESGNRGSERETSLSVSLLLKGHFCAPCWALLCHK